MARLRLSADSPPGAVESFRRILRNHEPFYGGHTTAFAARFFASGFGKLLNATMRVIATRLTRMILLVIAVEMFVAGASVVSPGLAARG